MDLDNLIVMANRIGSFFAAQPDRDEALAGIADHVKKFWEPRMRSQILAAVGTEAGAGRLGRAPRARGVGLDQEAVSVITALAVEPLLSCTVTVMLYVPLAEFG